MEKEFNSSRNLPLGTNVGLFITNTVTPENRGTVWQRSHHRHVLTNWIQEVKDFWSSLNGWLCVALNMNVCHCVASPRADAEILRDC